MLFEAFIFDFSPHMHAHVRHKFRSAQTDIRGDPTHSTRDRARAQGTEREWEQSTVVGAMRRRDAADRLVAASLAVCVDRLVAFRRLSAQGIENCIQPQWTQDATFRCCFWSSSATQPPSLWRVPAVYFAILYFASQPPSLCRGPARYFTLLYGPPLSCASQRATRCATCAFGARRSTLP